MMAVPAGFGVIAGIECMEGSATYLQDSKSKPMHVISAQRMRPDCDICCALMFGASYMM
jgi:hypothetical protein